MKELEITKGEWQYEIYAGYFAIQNSAGYEASDLLNADSVGSFEAEHNAELICDAGNTAQSCGLLPSELLRQRDELKEALAEQKRLYFNLFDEEIRCMYCEAEISRGSAIILCKECAENTEL